MFPFLTSYDPLGTSEGTLDPLGLYQIADQLAVQLVAAVHLASGDAILIQGNRPKFMSCFTE